MVISSKDQGNPAHGTAAFSEVKYKRTSRPMENENAPATKQDVAILREEMDRLHDVLVERIAEIEMKLSRAFYTFAESNQARAATIETGSEAVKKRVGSLEERVLDLERRVNFPNHPPQ
jgi:hypothetical protein